MCACSAAGFWNGSGFAVSTQLLLVHSHTLFVCLPPSYQCMCALLSCCAQQAGLSGVAHIGVRKDYSPVIQAALDSEGFTAGERRRAASSSATVAD